MAIHGANNDSENDQKFDQSQSQSFQQDGAAPGYNPNAGQSVPGSIFEALNRRQNIAVPESLKTSIKQMQDFFEEKYPHDKVEVEQYQSVPSVFGFSLVDTDGVRNVALIGFVQLMSQDLAVNEPASNKLSNVYKNFDFNTTRVIENLVVTREDIENNLEIIQATIDSAFIRARYPAENDITLNDFSGVVSFEVKSRNLDDVLGFLQAHSPSTIPPRAEFGFIASAKVDMNVFNRLAPEEQERVRQQGFLDGTPYMAVAACLDWIGPLQLGVPGAPGQTQAKIIPVITMTQSYSRLQLPSDTILAWILADDIFINCELWKTAARTTANPCSFFTKDQNDPSQGRLEMSFDEFERAFPTLIDAPVLSMDIGVGRETNDFAYNFTDPSTAQKVVAVAEHVLMDVQKTVRQTMVQSYENNSYRGIFTEIGWEYQGVVRHRGVDMDSRKVTRLSAIKSGAGAQDISIVEGLVPFSADPTVRLRAIEAINGAGSFRALYNVKKVAIDPTFLRAISSAFTRSGMKIFDLDNLRRVQQMGTVDGTMFAGLGINPNQFSAFTNPWAQGQQGPTSPFANPMGGYTGPRFGG